MGKGRAPCCDKSKVKKGPWSPAEDLRLISFIQKHGHGNWRALPKQAGLLRCGKSCRLRWINYLRPDVKRGNFTKEEEETIIKLHQSFGNKWSKIASSLPGRTDNEIKNVWNTHLKKRLIDYNKKDHETEFSSSPPSSTDASSFVPSFENHEDMRDQGLQDQGCLAKISPHQVCNIVEVLEKGQDSLIGTLTNSPITKEQFGTQDFNLYASIPITDEPKEASSSSSISSYASNHSNSRTRVDVSMPQEEGDSLVNCVLGPCDVDNTTYGVLNNQSSVAFDNQVMIEIDQLKPDTDFWDMLDNLDPMQSSESQPQDQYLELASQNLNNFGEECEQREIECRRWLRYLETELGLVEATRDGGHYQDYINPTKDAAGDGQTMLMWPETDIQSFGI